MAFDGLNLSPGWIFFIYIFIPFGIFGVSVLFASRKDRAHNDLTRAESISYLLVRFCSMISGSHFLWSIIILANQLLLTYYQLDFAKDIYYYTNVDNSNFNNLNSFHYSQVQISYNALSSIGFENTARRLLDGLIFDEDLLVNGLVQNDIHPFNSFNNNIGDNDSKLSSFYSKIGKSYSTKSLEFVTPIPDSPYSMDYIDLEDIEDIDNIKEIIKNRKLQATNVGSTLTIAYHTKDFSNLLNYESLTSLCKIEQAILSDPYFCLDTSDYQSIFPTLFNRNCILYRPITSQVVTLAKPENARFVVDNFDMYTPYNPVFFSYFKVGKCKNYLGTTIDEDLNKFADEENSTILDSNKKIMLTFSSYDVTKDDIYNEGFVLFYLFFAGFSICYVLLIFTSRKFFFPSVIFFMIFFSVVNSTAILISFGFKQLSMLSLVGTIVIILYGVNYSITFSYVWRRKMNPRSYFHGDDEEAFKRFKEEEFEPRRFSHMVGAYAIVAKSFFHSLILSIIFLTLLSTIDILAVRQFALFTLIGIISIFVTFHLLLIPFWIASSHHVTIDDDENYFWNQINILLDKFDESMNQIHCNFGVDSMNLCYLLFVGEERYNINNNVVVINDDVTREQKRQELKADKSLMGRIRYYFSDQLKIYGALMLLIIFVIFIAIMSTNTKNYDINFNYPPYLVNKKYILRQYTIFYDFKNDFMRNHNPTFLNVVKSISPSPTRAPVPSIAPTRAPTILGRQPSRAPTVLIPSDLNKDSEKNYVNFYLNTCYGITSVKDGTDDIAYGKYDPLSFNNYLNSLKFYNDIENLCDYVELNREDLAIDPNWVKRRDCIYSQYTAMNETLKSYQHTQADVIYELSSTSYGQGSLFGFLSYNKVNMPAYICPNFTILANVSSIEENPEYILDLKSTWEEVFKKVGGVNAQTFGINQFVTSEAFTYPLINYYQNSFYSTYIFVSVLIIVLAILFFSSFDLILTFLSSFTMITMILLNFSFYFMTVSSSMNSIDLICFITSVVISIQFPVQLIEEYLVSRISFESDRINRDYHALSPVLARANVNTREAILIRFLAMLFLILPLLSSEFILFKRVVQLLVICDFLTIFCVIFVMPYIIALTCKTRCIETCCQIEEEESQDEEGVYEMTGLLNGNNIRNSNEPIHLETEPTAAPLLPPYDTSVGLTTAHSVYMNDSNTAVGLQRTNSFMSNNSDHIQQHPVSPRYNPVSSNESVVSNSSFYNPRPSSLRSNMFVGSNANFQKIPPPSYNPLIPMQYHTQQPVHFQQPINGTQNYPHATHLQSHPFVPSNNITQLPVATGIPLSSSSNGSVTSNSIRNPMFMTIDAANQNSNPLASHSSTYLTTNPRFNQPSVSGTPLTGSNRGMVRQTSSYISQNNPNKDKSN